MNEEQAAILIEQNAMLIQLGSNVVFCLVAVSFGLSMLVALATWQLIVSARRSTSFT